MLVDRQAADDVAYAATGQAGLVVCVSEPVADWVRALVRTPTRSTPSPTASTPGASARPHGRDLPTFTLGFVGTLKPRHGVEDLVRAFAILHAADPSYRLLLVGDGPERGRIEQRSPT